MKPNLTTAIVIAASAAFALNVWANYSGQDSPRTAAARAAQGAPPTVLAAAEPVSPVRVSVAQIYKGSALVMIENVSGERLRSVFLHCTFRDQSGARIDSVPVLVHDLAPGDTANESADMPNQIRAARVECLTESAR
jgi:hypothetical protein